MTDPAVSREQALILHNWSYSARVVAVAFLHLLDLPPERHHRRLRAAGVYFIV